jgi:hypothetical protein
MWSVVKSEILEIKERNQLQCFSWETSVELLDDPVDIHNI